MGSRVGERAGGHFLRGNPFGRSERTTCAEPLFDDIRHRLALRGQLARFETVPYHRAPVRHIARKA